ncbi:hypothetical protein ACVI1I_006627 [Bradyrhizobium sp. USDA 4459]
MLPKTLKWLISKSVRCALGHHNRAIRFADRH